MSLGLALGCHLAAVALALVGVEARARWLLMIGKPLATLTLLLVAGLPPWPSRDVGQAVAAGILLSTAGDVALLWDGERAFLAGIGLFLLAHVAYLTAAWWGGGLAAMSSPLALVVILVAGSSVLVLRRVIRGAPAALRVPIVVYGTVISAMVVAALLTLAGPWPAHVAGAAAIGAVLFYASDGVLAWNRWVSPLPHGQTLTLALYWTGQCGLALAVRWGVTT